MRNSVLFVAGVVLVLVLTASKPAHAESYRYVRWIDPDVATIEPLNKRIVIGGDARYKTEFCGETEAYVCFTSAGFSFAVPKDLRPDTKNWSVKGKRYELVKRDVSISVFGRRIHNLYLIRGSADASVGPQEFLYSRREGLVAFGTWDLQNTFWLEGEHGFGAAEAPNQLQ